MKREILFRGKRTDNGEWIEGQFVLDAIDDPRIVVKDKLAKGLLFVHVIPETVSQFINIFDKNGNKIFHGDRMKGIFWNQGMARAKNKEIEFTVSFDPKIGFFIDCVDYGEFRFFPGMEDCEVIGNIHENKEQC